MAQQSASANGVRIALWSVFEEIDDDDEDVLEVTIEIHNQSAQDLWDLNGNIRDMDGTTALVDPNPLESKQVQVIGFHFDSIRYRSMVVQAHLQYRFRFK